MHINNTKREKILGGGEEGNPPRRTESKKAKSRAAHFVFSYLFLILLSTPFIFLISRQDFSIYGLVIFENRGLADAPDFKTTSFKDLPKQWDKYFSDKMPFRQVFMPGYLFVYEKFLKTFVTEYVTGHANELFDNHAAPIVDAALEIAPYSAQGKEHVRLTAAGKYAYFLSKGIPYYIFLVPDKTTLYPEFLPFYTKWIPHSSWYQEQEATLRKAHIKFYPLKDILWPFKPQERLYDQMNDTFHWNGNALAHAYDYMANVLAMDNHIFKPVEYGKYYEIETVPVNMGVYGSETTTFIKLKKTENFSCSILPEQYRSDGYNQFCINHTVPSGSLWFYSDSYFGDTHGSKGVSPFVHNVHTYIHRHYFSPRPFTQLADDTLKFNKPDAVIEEFVSRMYGTQNSIFEPLLRILGDFWMKTGGIILDHKTDLSAFSMNNIDQPNPDSSEFDFKTNNRLTLKAPAVADDLGRVVVMGKINSPANAVIRVFYREEGNSSEEKIQDIGIAQGAQVFHQTVYAKPYSKVKLSLQFLTPGKYRFEKIKEIDDLREKM